MWKNKGQVNLAGLQKASWDQSSQPKAKPKNWDLSNLYMSRVVI